jgi:protein O-mannosyl-transferase
MLNKITIGSGKQKLIVYLVLTAVTLAVFWQVNQFDFINVDDPIYVTGNSHIHSGITPDGLRWALGTTYAEFWHPLTWLSLMFDYQFYGLHAGGYHVTNLILHIMSALLLFGLFNRMTGAIWRSAFVAALFALHPLRVQSVVFVAERKDVLCAFFCMLTLCLYVYYTEKPVIKRYLPVLFSFALALMSKSMAVTLPVIMILLDYWPLGRFEPKKNNADTVFWQLREKIPFFILSAVFSIITIYVQRGPVLEYTPYSLSSRIANAPVSFLIYLEKIFMPGNLAAFYVFPDQPPLWHVLGAISLIAVISVAVIAAGKRLPYLFAGWFWYVITIAPVIGIILIARSGNRPLADHYTYLPSIGIAVGLAWGMPLLFPREETRKKVLFPAGIAVLAILSVLTWRQCGYWKNSITLANHTLQVTKDNYSAYTIRGNAYSVLGQYQLAFDDFDEAIRLKPDYIPVYIERGNLYAKLGRYQRAFDDFNEAIRLKPDYPIAYNNRGNTYTILGRYQSAIEDYNETIRLKPDYADAYNSRGNIYAKLGQYQLAIKDYNETIRLNPYYANSYNIRGSIYAMLGQSQHAIEDFNEAIRLKPDFPEPYNNRGIAHFMRGNKELGCPDAHKACALGKCGTLELAKGKGLCR